MKLTETLKGKRCIYKLKKKEIRRELNEEVNKILQNTKNI